MTARTLGRLTAHEFAAFRPFLRNDPDRVEVARLVLVEGLTHEAAGQRYGLSRVNVTMLMAAVAKSYERHQRAQAEADQAVAALLPPGWERATVVAPRQLLERLRAEVENAAQSSTMAKEKSPKRSRVSGRKT